MSSKVNFLAKYSWTVLLYNVFVILVGAFVRATGSGAGCGAHWPLCNGVVVPREPAIETSIEFFHRITSGLTLPLVVILLILSWRHFPKPSRGRRWAVLALVFTITEALIGAGLVLFGLVAENDSMIRAYSMISHLVNTFLLLGFITLTAWWATFGEPIRGSSSKMSVLFVAAGFMGMFILGASGAITALGDTLFPASSLADGLRQDFDQTAHIFLRLRIMHPVIAIIVSAYMVWVSFRLADFNKQEISYKLALSQSVLIVVQLGLGVTNILLLAPVWLQLVHLFITCLIWINFVVASVTGLIVFDFPPGVFDHEIDHRINKRTEHARQSEEQPG